MRRVTATGSRRNAAATALKVDLAQGVCAGGVTDLSNPR
jgi:hypothetical protein